MAIELIKLINGETIMGDVVGIRGYNVDLLNPIEIRVENRPNRAVMIGVQWLPLIEDENIVSIDSQHVIASMPVNEDMREMYFEVVEYLVHPDLYRKRQTQKEDDLNKMVEMIRMYANTEGQYH